MASTTGHPDFSFFVFPKPPKLSSIKPSPFSSPHTPFSSHHSQTHFP
ncbi:putative wiskott-Aldrich syndrome protein family member 2 [Iris pallida]|uniref:Wiskott-Aldrich syndrome protein family member 2 n=1 Tax=Iris pallida TaxID=29817 RepID=A0AAX6EP38_IRIPA|nr:putative wiskott-Aldrich syndrome protein family member 2 [Iris pallida]